MTRPVFPLGGERGLYLPDDRLERCRLADREIGQHLAVDGDVGLAQAGNEAAVVQPERPHGGVETLDPQRAAGALAPFAVAESVLVCLLHRLLGDADGVLAPAEITLGGFENFLVLGMRSDTAFDASHGRSPLKICRTLNRIAAVAARRQPFGRKYFLMLSPSVLNSTLVPRSWRICFLVRLIMP